MKDVVKGFLIDIDGTIVNLKKDEFEKCRTHGVEPFFKTLEDAGIDLAGLSRDECVKRIDKVKKDVRWWVWEDFIDALELDPEKFWDYAYEVESKYLEATGPELLSALTKLKEGGASLYIASNNPNSGIRHKLRIAGVEKDLSDRLFDGYFGVSEMHYMKWDREYWKKAISMSGLSGKELAVVGDNLNDDFEVPNSAGISKSFIINRKEDKSSENTDSIININSFDQLIEHI